MKIKSYLNFILFSSSFLFCQVSFYGDSDFKGSSEEYSLGDYPKVGSHNDKFSSIEIPNDYQVVIYQHGDYKGRKTTLTKSIKNLNDIGFNDYISSLKVEKYKEGSSVVTVYDNGDYKGRYQNYGFGDHNRVWLNDKISSIKIADGYEVVIYNDGDFKGKEYLLTADESNLKDIGFNDKISSIKIIKFKKANAIIAYGEGKSKDSAISDALRNAIEVGLGTYITSVTEMKDYEVIKDKITQLSRGFVKNYDILEESQIDDLFRISISAIITREEIVQFAPSIGMKVELAGGKLFQKFAMKNQEKNLELETIKQLAQSAIYKTLIFNPIIQMDEPFMLLGSSYEKELKSSINKGLVYAVNLAIILEPIYENLEQVNKFTKSFLEKTAKSRVAYNDPEYKYNEDKSLIFTLGGRNQLDFNYKAMSENSLKSDQTKKKVSCGELGLSKYSRDCEQHLKSQEREVLFTQFPESWTKHEYKSEQIPINNLVISLLGENLYFVPDQSSRYDINGHTMYKFLNDESIKLISENYGVLFHKHNLILELQSNSSENSKINLNIDLLSGEGYYSSLKPSFNVSGGELINLNIKNAGGMFLYNFIGRYDSFGVSGGNAVNDKINANITFISPFPCGQPLFKKEEACQGDSDIDKIGFQGLLLLTEEQLKNLTGVSISYLKN